MECSEQHWKGSTVASKWFDELSDKAQGFLIATLLFRSKERETSFAFLEATDSQMLAARAQSILELDRNQRVRLLVAQLRRLLMVSSQPWILAVEPSWIIELLSKEERAMQRLALASLPRSLVFVVGSGLAFSRDEIEQLPVLPLALSAAIRGSIEGQLTPMRAVSFEISLTPSLLLVLTRSELEVVILELSKTQIAGEQDGLKLIAILLSNESPALQKEIAQRLNVKSGRRMLDYIENADLDLEALHKVRIEIYSILIKLGKERKIDERFAQCFFSN